MDNETEDKIQTIDEIDLIDVLRKIWHGRKIIYKSIGVCLIFGLIIALGTPKEYKSEVTLLFENESKSANMSGLLQQFGGLAGLNLGSLSGSPDALRPYLYPDIIKSMPFLLEVLNQKVTESKYDSTITIAGYLDHHTRSSLGSLILGYTIGLPGKIIERIRENKKANIKNQKEEKGLFRITQKQSDLAKSLLGCIKAKDEDANTTLIISVEMQDPVVAAQVTDSVVRNLTQYIIDYRTQKSKDDLKFVADRHKEAESKYIEAQRALATYRDQNKNVISAYAKTEEERLQAEYTLAFNIFNTLSQQLEQSTIKVQQETPVFKVLNPAQVPLKKSKPQTSLIIITMILIGVFTGIVIIFGKSTFKNFTSG